MNPKQAITAALIIACTAGYSAGKTHAEETTATTIPMVVLRDDKETPATTDLGVAGTPVQTIASDISVFGNFTGNKILDWMLIPESTNKGKKAKGGFQSIVFDLESDMNGTIKIPGYKDLVPPQPAWHEWFNPRLFLVKWTDYWFNGCDAAPVVFVSFTF